MIMINQKLQCKELAVVARLQAHGTQCHKQLIELALENPNSDRTPSPPCGNCGICSADNEMWPPLCKEGVRLVLFDVFTQPQFVGGKYVVKEVAKEIMKYPNASRHLFSVNSDKAPTIGSVNKVLFIMIAWGMIQLDIDEEDFDVVLRLAKVSLLNMNLIIMNNTLWENIVTRASIVEYNT